MKNAAFFVVSIVAALIFVSALFVYLHKPEIKNDEMDAFVTVHKEFMDTLASNTCDIARNAATIGWEMRDKGASLNELNLTFNKLCAGDTNAITEWRKNHP